MTERQQQSLALCDYARGQLNALEILERHFQLASDRGQQYWKTEQIAQFIASVRLTLEKESMKL